MKKIKLGLELSKAVLSKEQMKKISGGYSGICCLCGGNTVVRDTYSEGCWVVCLPYGFGEAYSGSC